MQGREISLTGETETPAQKALRMQMEKLEGAEKSLENAIKAQTAVIQQQIDQENAEIAGENAGRPQSAQGTAQAQIENQSQESGTLNLLFGGGDVLDEGANINQRAAILEEFVALKDDVLERK